MNNDNQKVMEELKELRGIVNELKKNIEEKNLEIKELRDYLKLDKRKKGIKKDDDLTTVINSNDPEKWYKYALNNQDKDCSKLEQLIIDSKDLATNYKYLVNIGGARSNEHLKIIMDSKNPEYNYYVAIKGFLKDEQIAEIKQIILDSNNLEYIYRFATDLEYIYHDHDVSKIDTSDLEKKILDGLDLKYYYLFCKKVPNANIELFQDYMLEFASEKDINFLFFFATDIENADIKRLKDKISELYRLSDDKHKINDLIEECEKIKRKCLFRYSFGEPLNIK